MADYIDRQAAIRALIAAITPRINGSTVTVNIMSDQMIATTINSLPSADVAAVVRCKDCIYWQDNNGGYPHEECRWGHDETPDSDDYCSYGEQKDG